MGQLPLALRLNRHASFDSFVSGKNLAAVLHVKAVAAAERAESVWLTGAVHTGKSHLLAAACRAASDKGLQPMYLAVDAAADPGVLRDLDSVDLLALDDLQHAAGSQDWEAMLFSVIDARLQRGGLLMAAERSPRDCGFELPDLVSRASAASVYRLIPLNDGGLLQAVSQQAALRGLELEDAAASYLLQRVGRDLGALMDWLDRIDHFALAAQRRITIPLLRQVIDAASGD